MAEAVAAAATISEAPAAAHTDNTGVTSGERERERERERENGININSMHSFWVGVDPDSTEGHLYLLLPWPDVPKLRPLLAERGLTIATWTRSGQVQLSTISHIIMFRSFLFICLSFIIGL